MWTGAKPIESPYLLIGQISTFGYFFYLLVIIPFFSELQNFFYNVRLYFPFFVKENVEDNGYENFVEKTVSKGRAKLNL